MIRLRGRSLNGHLTDRTVSVCVCVCFLCRCILWITALVSLALRLQVMKVRYVYGRRIPL